MVSPTARSVASSRRQQPFSTHDANSVMPSKGFERAPRQRFGEAPSRSSEIFVYFCPHTWRSQRIQPRRLHELDVSALFCPASTVDNPIEHPHGVTRGLPRDGFDELRFVTFPEELLDE